MKVSYLLDPWGQITEQTGASVNRQIFTGQEHDEKTGLIYFGARFYDPDTARFITQDAYLGESGMPPSLHRYLYAYSNPTAYVDPDGHFVISGAIAAYAALSAVISWEASVIHEEITEGSSLEKAASNPIHMMRGAAVGGSVLSGGTLGPLATAGMVGIGAGYDVAAQSAYEGKAYDEVDYEHSLLTGGMFAPLGLLGKGIQSANAAIRLGSYSAVGAMSGYGAYVGGNDFAGGIRDGNYARAALGVSEMMLGGLGVYGTIRGIAGSVPKPNDPWSPDWNLWYKQNPNHPDARFRSVGAAGNAPKSGHELYDIIRKSNTDVANISKYYNLKEDRLYRIKDYVFNNPKFNRKHKGTAESWLRLAEGKGTAHDKMLLKHETVEIFYNQMNKNNPKLYSDKFGDGKMVDDLSPHEVTNYVGYNYEQGFTKRGPRQEM